MTSVLEGRSIQSAMLASPATPEVASRRRRSSFSSSGRGSCSTQQRRSSVTQEDAELSTQAKLLQGRGDLRGARLCFDVDLQSPPISTKNPLRGLGVQLSRAGGDVRGATKLRVADIAETYKGVRTSAGQWNNQEHQRRRAVCALRPGDMVCSVNGSPDEDYDAMLEELATSSPSHARALRVERELDHLLAPSGTITRFDAVPDTLGSSSCSREVPDAKAGVELGSGDSLAGDDSCGPRASKLSGKLSVFALTGLALPPEGPSRKASAWKTSKGRGDSLTSSELSTRLPTPACNEDAESESDSVSWKDAPLSCRLPS